jgi:hypothetical protein
VRRWKGRKGLRCKCLKVQQNKKSLKILFILKHFTFLNKIQFSALASFRMLSFERLKAWNILKKFFSLFCHSWIIHKWLPQFLLTSSSSLFTYLNALTQKDISLIGKCVSYVNSSFHLFTSLCLFMRVNERERGGRGWKKQKQKTTLFCWAESISLYDVESFNGTYLNEQLRERRALNRLIRVLHVWKFSLWVHFEWVDNALSNLQ